MTRTTDRERGGSVASVMIVMMIVFMFFELIVMGGRIAAAQGEVNGAAREAARQGSLAQNSRQARDVAEVTADANLPTNKRSCTETDISSVVRSTTTTAASRSQSVAVWT